MRGTVQTTMSSLTPENMLRAQSTALNTYESFPASEMTTGSVIDSVIAVDTPGCTLLHVLDKSAQSLARKATTDDKALAKYTVSSYFGNVKNHCLDVFESQGEMCERKLEKIGSSLDKHCAAMDSAFTNKAPACTASDEEALTSIIYKNAATAKYYGDAELLNVLWYVFVVRLDTLCLLKSQLSVYPGKQ